LSKEAVVAGVAGFVIVAILSALLVTNLLEEPEPVPSFAEQACGLPDDWLDLTKRGYFEPRSGQIALLPRTPAYMASGGDGWSHSGPWPYLQEIPLVFYGPGIIPRTGVVETPATLADIAPTMATMLRGSFRTDDGKSLTDVVRLNAKLLKAKPPKLILTIVWDGGGWNVLGEWPGDWSNLRMMMNNGVAFDNATVGSSPSVTPAVHTTMGTGVWPSTHGITGVSMRDEGGEVVDSFLKGESSRFIQVPTLAERWDEQTGGRAKVGMLGYEPWHLGMIGKGAEQQGGDKDDAIWLNVETNEWITNPDHYRLPPSVIATEGLDEDLAELDASDGRIDGKWLEHDILDQPDRVEETPAFIEFHARALMNMIKEEGYGDDRVTDLLYTNFKQIDRVGHYFNMASEEVNASLLKTDEVLGDILSFLDDEVGKGNYAVVLTADHGQQPDAPDIDAYGINPRQVEEDIDAEFGPITRAVWPTEVFLLEDEMQRLDVSVEEVAEFLGRYTVGDNRTEDRFTGRFDDPDRIFDLAIPAKRLEDISC
jgi:hypothetical protein